MTDKKTTTGPGAVELTEEDLEKARGGAKCDGVDGVILKKKVDGMSPRGWSDATGHLD